MPAIFLCSPRERRWPLSIVDKLAQKLKKRPSEVLLLGATELGFTNPESQSAVWLARHIECRTPDSQLNKELFDWCLAKLYPPQEILLP